MTIHSTTRGMLSSLAIRPAQRTDTGVYGCYAKNKHGFADMSMWLTVLGIKMSLFSIRIIYGVKLYLFK